MRVLLLHNRYRALGGEERAVADIAALLQSRGHQVHVLERFSEAAGRVRAARALVRGGVDEREVNDAVRQMGADVVHVHNIHPLFGWRALAAARAAGARTILHLHNFRLFCAIGVAFRFGRACIDEGAAVYPGQSGADGLVGDHALVTPPLVITPDQVDDLIGAIDRGLTRLEAELSISA